MKTDSELIANALNMHANWIETGNVTLNANDVAARTPKGQQPKVKVLDDDQKELVLRLRRLARGCSKHVVRFTFTDDSLAGDG